ncbi:MAG TPA: ABC transporter permease [Puia sp.]|jgi:putative ABC transport system permease protein|nr:ABC transporter permease [Puia sp.]
MFKNNLKIAWRNLMKDRQFTFLNLLGLSTGIACTLLIYLWVHDEYMFDKFHEKDSRLYQLMEHRNSGGQVTIADESSGLLGETIAAQNPEVEFAAAEAPASWFQKFTLSVDEKNLKATGQYVGKDYFNIFSFKLIEGNPDKVLADKSNIVISDELAKKLFNTTENLIGKKILFQHDQIFFVSGVFEKVPVHSSEQFDFVLSFEYYKQTQPWVGSWNNTGPHNFIVLKKGTDLEAFNKRIEKVITRNGGDTTRSPFAFRFSYNYLQNSFDHGNRIGGRIVNVKLFSVIAFFILTIACINFMNLSTAKASRRLKEVGIKKVVGAGKAQLVFQFMGESILLTAIAVCIAIAMVILLLPQFNQITGKEIHLDFNSGLIGGLIVISLFTGFVSGSYPALYLAGFNPIMILKGKMRTSIGEVWARRGLVIFQFTISIFMIVGVLVIYKQIQYLQKKDLGYGKDHIIRFDCEGKLIGTEENFIARLKKIPGVVNASFTFNIMIGRNFGNYGISWEGKNPSEPVYFEGFGGGYDFIETMGMKMAEGRSFSKNFGNESNKVIVNEEAVKIMGLKNPVGKNIVLFEQPEQIIGVVKDFHFESLRETVKPIYMTLLKQDSSPWSKIMIRIQSGKEIETVDRIRSFYESYNPGFPFDFHFLDELYEKQYASELRVGILSKYFAGLAILISCLGLFGLTAFTAQKRQKEIGIRKVIGASVPDLVLMLSRDLFKQVLIAICVAVPFSWWTMSQWLNGFAYRIPMSFDVFLIAGLSIIIITIITVSFQSVKAAYGNPVVSLRSE